MSPIPDSWHPMDPMGQVVKCQLLPAIVIPKVCLPIRLMGNACRTFSNLLQDAPVRY